MVLTGCLQELEDAHIISRIQYQEIPPRVEYSLTTEGKELVENLDNMRAWGTMIFAKYPEGLEKIK
ncbi:hypothetical protein bsdtb5_38700 [Anaeromicropila herbilytica]|uniref:HTH hxlR-type domain-containing protein n=2 Tax=Anaeromicropila herbilytica TaxID=2785025 RepID=A0A7R7EPA3_9FIRM|nr:hypothetical protein bsdtb5_38700 [Anaeromicropila herbilytica]